VLLSNQVRERCLPLLRESQSLLPPLEEMEKNITGFYQALEKASHITGAGDSEGPVDFKQKCQVTNARVSIRIKAQAARYEYMTNTQLAIDRCRSW